MATESKDLVRHNKHLEKLESKYQVFFICRLIFQKITQ